MQLLLHLYSVSQNQLSPLCGTVVLAILVLGMLHHDLGKLKSLVR